jgi:glycosyltransferase involved in cell wall biosynthesis
MSPKVSIVMCVWNGAMHLRESIDSILTQTFRDFEFVVVNDASTDETAQILNEYAQRDARIKILTNEKNIGLTKSLNRGIRASHGIYIARIDAGDTSESTRFAQQVQFLDEHPDYGLVGAWTHVIDDNSQIIGDMKYPTDTVSLKKDLIKYNPFVHSSVMMRRDILEKTGLYDESWKYAQDYELFLRISTHAHIANIGTYLVSYRMSPVSITSDKNKEQIMCAIRARIKAIRAGQYGIASYVYILKPLLGYILPYSLKKAIKKLFAI